MTLLYKDLIDLVTLAHNPVSVDVMLHTVIICWFNIAMVQGIINYYSSTNNVFDSPLNSKISKHQRYFDCTFLRAKYLSLQKKLKNIYLTQKSNLSVKFLHICPVFCKSYDDRLRANGENVPSLRYLNKKELKLYHKR